MRFLRWLLLVLLVSGNVLPIQACDLCGVYTAIESSRGAAGTTNMGSGFQYSSFESGVRPGGDDSLPSQFLNSSVLQAYVDHNLTDKWALQMNVPLIYRTFRRVESGAVDSGSESGIGDIPLLIKYEPYRYHSDTASFHLELQSGVRLPTGSTDRFAEEQEEVSSRGFFRHGGFGGRQVSGSDLALGSGATEWMNGFNFLAERSQFFLSGAAQYWWRTEGDYGYRFGNDLQWHVGPGYYLLVTDDESLSLRLRLSGERKEADAVFSQTLEGSEDRRLFLGPEIAGNIGTRWSGLMALSGAISTEGATDQVVPRLRVLAQLSRKFQ